MVTFIALYRGAEVSTARLVTLSADPGLVQRFADALLHQAREGIASHHDTILTALDGGRENALRLIAGEEAAH